MKRWCTNRLNRPVNNNLGLCFSFLYQCREDLHLVENPLFTTVKFIWAQAFFSKPFLFLRLLRHIEVVEPSVVPQTLQFWITFSLIIHSVEKWRYQPAKKRTYKGKNASSTFIPFQIFWRNWAVVLLLANKALFPYPTGNWDQLHWQG